MFNRNLTLNLQPFTDRAKNALSNSSAYAKEHQHKATDVLHMLMFMLKDKDTLAGQVLRESGVQLDEVTALVDAQKPYRHLQETERLLLTPEFMQVLRASGEHAGKWEHTKIGTEHVLIAMARCKHQQVNSLLSRHGLTPVSIEQRVVELYYIQANLPLPSEPESVNSLDETLRSVSRWIDAMLQRVPLRPPYPQITEDNQEAVVIRRLIETPEHLPLHCTRGQQLLQREQYSAAIAEFDTAIRLEPTHAEAYYFRGYAREHQRDYDRAAADYTAAIDLGGDKDFPDLPFRRGSAYLFAGDLMRAYADFTTATTNEQFAPFAFAQRAYCTLSILNFDVALSDLKRALKIDPKHGLTLVYLGFLETERGAFEQAEVYFQQVIQFKPSWVTPAGYLSLLRWKQNRVDKALQFAVQAIVGGSINALPFYVRGKVYAQQGEREKAVADFQTALKYYPNPDAPLHKPYIDEMKAYLAQG